MNVAEKLGARIQKLRTERGLSQEELADQSGLHRTYISHIERGSRNITVVGLCKVAKGLKLTPSELMDGVRV